MEPHGEECSPQHGAKSKRPETALMVAVRSANAQLASELLLGLKSRICFHDHVGCVSGNLDI